jgi:hypothetical protein
MFGFATITEMGASIEAAALNRDPGGAQDGIGRLAAYLDDLASAAN